MDEHVILVAFQVEAESREAAHEALLHEMPKYKGHPFARPTQPVICWWVAEDDRTDMSDNDSAVFVHPGAQRQASLLLSANDLTGAHNIIAKGERVIKDSRFDGTQI